MSIKSKYAIGGDKVSAISEINSKYDDCSILTGKVYNRRK